jgi:hypothetical protein
MGLCMFYISYVRTKILVVIFHIVIILKELDLEYISWHILYAEF